MSEEFRKEEEQPNIYIKPGKTYSKFLQPEEKKTKKFFWCRNHYITFGGTYCGNICLGF